MPNDSHNDLAIAKGIALSCRMGAISYDEAKKKVEPYLERVNAKAREIAKKYGKKHYNLTFTGLVR